MAWLVVMLRRSPGWEGAHAARAVAVAGRMSRSASPPSAPQPGSRSPLPCVSAGVGATSRQRGVPVRVLAGGHAATRVVETVLMYQM